MLIAGLMIPFCTEKPTPQDVRFCLVWMDSVPHSAIEAVADVLFDSLNIRVEKRRISGPPDSVWSATRKRYNAAALLQWMGKRQGADTSAFQLLVTDKDLGVQYKEEMLKGANGLSVQGGLYGVISDYRLHQFGRSRDSVDFYLGKVALHEVGHMLGLSHCKTAKCIMESVEVKQHITTLGGFCMHCKKKNSQM